MTDWRLEHAGTVCDAHGEETEIGVLHPEGADPEADEEPVVTIGTGISLGQEEAEVFARVFVSACWEAGRYARQVPRG